MLRAAAAFTADGANERASKANGSFMVLRCVVFLIVGAAFDLKMRSEIPNQTRQRDEKGREARRARYDCRSGFPVTAQRQSEWTLLAKRKNTIKMPTLLIAE
jgi:hypothetical protein